MKTPSAKIASQSYLVRVPAQVHLESVRSGQEISLGAATWRAEEPGQVIVGTSGQKQIEVFKSPIRTLEDFANVGQSPEDVLRFTRRYGALHKYDHPTTSSPYDEVESEFLIVCAEWLSNQQTFLRHWELARNKGQGLEDWLSSQFRLGSLESKESTLGVAVMRTRGRLSLQFRPGDLWQALCMMLLNNYERVRKCKNETCPSGSYFVAQRRDQKYCDENCARLVANRQWWRRNRSRKKGGSNGSQR